MISFGPASGFSGEDLVRRQPRDRSWTFLEMKVSEETRLSGLQALVQNLDCAARACQVAYSADLKILDMAKGGEVSQEEEVAI